MKEISNEMGFRRRFQMINLYKPLIGKRIRLISTSDEYTNLKPGDEGTIDLVDDAGTIFVSWDRGGNLGLIPGIDKYNVLAE